jgi:phosphatidylserine/phosphatidylglycerophosphate/cardiolipin synthase-like enzyme
MILEFEEPSGGQLLTDAVRAFPPELSQRSNIYYWPLENRETNALGKPAKLHAKVAVIDDQAVLSSANLTDDAFSRNLELGALFSCRETVQRMREYFNGLCTEGVLRLWCG